MRFIPNRDLRPGQFVSHRDCRIHHNRSISRKYQSQKGTTKEQSPFKPKKIPAPHAFSVSYINNPINLFPQQYLSYHFRLSEHYETQPCVNQVKDFPFPSFTFSEVQLTILRIPAKLIDHPHPHSPSSPHHNPFTSETHFSSTYAFHSDDYARRYLVHQYILLNKAASMYCLCDVQKVWGTKCGEGGATTRQLSLFQMGIRESVLAIRWEASLWI